MSIGGNWDVTIATPIGTQHVQFSFTHDPTGWHGWAQGRSERVELFDLTVNGNRASWSQSITKPIRLNLAFDVEVDHDQVTGTSKAGKLPSSSVHGQRTTNQQ